MTLIKFEPTIQVRIGSTTFLPFVYLGDNQRDKWYEWNPFININCARIWQHTKSFGKFLNLLDESITHEYLHLFIRIEATQPPFGTGSIFLEWKGEKEEPVVRKLVEVMYTFEMSRRQPL